MYYIFIIITFRFATTLPFKNIKKLLENDPDTNLATDFPRATTQNYI